MDSNSWLMESNGFCMENPPLYSRDLVKRCWSQAKMRHVCDFRIQKLLGWLDFCEWYMFWLDFWVHFWLKC